MLREAPLPTEVEVEKRGPITKMCEPQPFWRASSTLLSRLAEAVDGNRKGEPVVYVAEYRYDPQWKGHEVHGPFETCKEARRFRKYELDDEAGEIYGIFGPFWTKKARSGTTSARGGPMVERVVLHLTGGRTIELHPEDADAVFWSAAAVEKFVIPYYVGIGTVEEGQTILGSLDDGVALVHRPGSEWRSETSRILVDGKPLDEDPGIGTVVIGVKQTTEKDGQKVFALPLV
jgi:hypothetical protein